MGLPDGFGPDLFGQTDPPHVYSHPWIEHRGHLVMFLDLSPSRKHEDFLLVLLFNFYSISVDSRIHYPVVGIYILSRITLMLNVQTLAKQSSNPLNPED